MEEKLLQKWLNNELTPSEREEFERRPDYGYIKQLLEDAKAFKADEFSAPPSFDELKSALPEQKPDNLHYLRPLLKVAAVLVVGIGIYFTFFNNAVTTIETAYSEQKTMLLPDESEVILNAGSQISFDTKNWEDARAVNLSGEAYFKVAKGRVFDVITADGKVSVLGTEFKVVQRNGLFEAVCYEGKVAVTFGDAKTELVPGMAISLLDGEVKQYSVSENEPTWLNNRSLFRDVPLRLVLNEVERQFDVVVNTTVNIKTRQFTGAFSHEDLQKALTQITAPLQLEFSVNGKEVTISEQSP